MLVEHNENGIKEIVIEVPEKQCPINNDHYTKVDVHTAEGFSIDCSEGVSIPCAIDKETKSSEHEGQYANKPDQLSGKCKSSRKNYRKRQKEKARKARRKEELKKRSVELSETAKPDRITVVKNEITPSVPVATSEKNSAKTRNSDPPDRAGVELLAARQTGSVLTNNENTKYTTQEITATDSDGSDGVEVTPLKLAESESSSTNANGEGQIPAVNHATVQLNEQSVEVIGSHGLDNLSYNGGRAAGQPDVSEGIGTVTLTSSNASESEETASASPGGWETSTLNGNIAEVLEGGPVRAGASVEPSYPSSEGAAIKLLPEISSYITNARIDLVNRVLLAVSNYSKPNTKVKCRPVVIGATAFKLERNILDNEIYNFDILVEEKKTGDNLLSVLTNELDQMIKKIEQKNQVSDIDLDFNIERIIKTEEGPKESNQIGCSRILCNNECWFSVNVDIIASWIENLSLNSGENVNTVIFQSNNEDHEIYIISELGDLKINVNNLQQANAKFTEKLNDADAQAEALKWLIFASESINEFKNRIPYYIEASEFDDNVRNHFSKLEAYYLDLIKLCKDHKEIMLSALYKKRFTGSRRCTRV